MTLPPLHLPLVSAGFFGGVVGRMLEFVALRVRRSDQGMAPSLSPDLRAQTVALHRRLAVLVGEFHRLAELARQGRLRVYPDRASPRPRAEGVGRRPLGAPGLPADPAFAQPPGVAQGPTLPAVATRGFGWMLGFVPAEYGPALAALLANPEMVALIQASPAVARLLRPLCRGLGVTPPEGVFPAPRRRAARARPTPRAAAPGDAGDTGDTDDTGGAAGTPAAAAPAGARAACRQARPGTTHAARQPAADALMSPQARARWWAARRGTGRADAGAAAPNPRADTPSQGWCAKC